MKRILTFVLAVLLVLPFLFVPALAAPIGDGVTETSGDGFALYNGVKLPNIDTVWTDKTSYPYAFIIQYSNSSFGLFVCGSNPVRQSDYNVSSGSIYRFYISGGFIRYSLFIGEEWTFQNSGQSTSLTEYSSGIYKFSVLWTVSTLFDTDGTSVYLYASSPKPLDGMTVIEWDGTVTNHNYLADHLWRVSDLTPTITQLTGGYSVFKSVSTGQLTVATLNVGSTLTQEDGYIYFTGGGVYPNANSPGIYFHKNNSDPVAEQVQTQLLAFSATEGGGGGVQPDPSDPTDPTVPDDPTDPTLSVDEKLDQIQQDQIVIQDTLGQIQSDQIITNDKLDHIDQNQGITNDKLDDIISGTVNPDIPSGGDIITDNDDLESQIKEDITPGIDSIGDWFTDSIETFEEYSGVFLIIIWLFDKIVDIGFFKPLLAIALSLGVVSSILGISITISTRSSRSRSDAEIAAYRAGFKKGREK